MRSAVAYRRGLGRAAAVLRSRRDAGARPGRPRRRPRRRHRRAGRPARGARPPGHRRRPEPRRARLARAPGRARPVSRRRSRGHRRRRRASWTSSSPAAPTSRCHGVLEIVDEPVQALQRRCRCLRRRRHAQRARRPALRRGVRPGPRRPPADAQALLDDSCRPAASGSVPRRFSRRQLAGAGARPPGSPSPRCGASGCSPTTSAARSSTREPGAADAAAGARVGGLPPTPTSWPCDPAAPARPPS